MFNVDFSLPYIYSYINLYAKLSIISVDQNSCSNKTEKYILSIVKNTRLIFEVNIAFMNTIFRETYANDSNVTLIALPSMCYNVSFL